jgi:hypothetical protein
MSEKFPSFQFYPGDWRKDMGVQSLPYQDRGIWFEMLCLMHESERRGVLVLNGRAMSDETLARVLGLDKQILGTTITTLLTSGVASREEDTGAIYCRRMVRDENIRKVRSAAGKKGGNPVLVKQNPTTGVKQNLTPSSSTSTSSSSSDKTSLAPDGATPSSSADRRAGGNAPEAPSIRHEEFAETWNRLRGPLPHVSDFTESRRRKVQARVRQGITLETFAEAVRRCSSTAFLLGTNDRGWKADFDWLIENDRNLLKVLEGKYDGTGGTNGTTRNGAHERVVDQSRGAFRKAAQHRGVEGVDGFARSDGGALSTPDDHGRDGGNLAGGDRDSCRPIHTPTRADSAVGVPGQTGAEVFSPSQRNRGGIGTNGHRGEASDFTRESVHPMRPL